MEEPRGYGFGSAEEYRIIQGLAREGNYREALERADRALLAGTLGRKHSARLHSLVSWLYAEALGENMPAAVLYGEEAVRLAGLLRDEWVLCEALARLVPAYCRLGDVDRALQACDMLAAELERNPAALEGGPALLWSLRATVAAARSDDIACLKALDWAEGCAEPGSAQLLAYIRAQRLLALVVWDRKGEVSGMLERLSGTEVEWDLARAWLTLENAGPRQALPLLERVLARALAAKRSTVALYCQLFLTLATAAWSISEARRMACLTHSRVIAGGRRDLAPEFQRRLDHLL